MKNLFQAVEYKGFLSLHCWENVKGKDLKFFILSYPLTQPTIRNTSGVSSHKHRILGSDSVSPTVILLRT